VLKPEQRGKRAVVGYELVGPNGNLALEDEVLKKYVGVLPAKPILATVL